MTYAEALQQLNDWIRQSSGSPIPLPSGESYGFERMRLYTEADLSEFEGQHGFRFPDSYRVFLQQVGACNLFVGRYGPHCSSIPIHDIPDHMREVFETRANPYPDLVLPIWLSGGLEAGFDLRTPAADRFSVFTPDEDPDEWLSEVSSWTHFDKWLVQLVSSSGEDVLPD